MLSVPPPGRPLTVERIRDLVSEIEAATKESRDVDSADGARLLWLAEVLSQGTIEDAVAREEAADAAMESRGAPPHLRAAATQARRARIDALRAVSDEEVRAVTAAVDDVERIFPGLAAGIRRRRRAG